MHTGRRRSGSVFLTHDKQRTRAFVCYDVEAAVSRHAHERQVCFDGGNER
jgi:hypothetical protein